MTEKYVLNGARTVVHKSEAPYLPKSNNREQRLILTKNGKNNIEKIM